MKLSLAQKLVWLIEVVVLLFVVVGGIAGYTILRRALIERTQSQLTSVSILKENSVKEYLSHAREELEFFPESAHRRAQFEKILSGSPSAKGEILESFAELIQDGHTFRDLFLLNDQGMVVVSSNPLDDGKIKSTEIILGAENICTIFIMT